MQGSQKKRDLIIVGGGASGAIALIKVLLQTDVPLKVTLFDPSPNLGLGRAYSTEEERHLLNVPADKMSVFQNHPLDFVDWLKVHHPGDFYAWPFVPRKFFGEYLKEKLAAIPTLTYDHVRSEVRSLSREGNTWKVKTSEGKVFLADDVIIATGYRNFTEQNILKEVDENAAPFILQAYDLKKMKKISGSDDVLIVGTGLSAMDVFMHLHDKTTGKIQFISRHAFFPKPHDMSAHGNGRLLPDLQKKSPVAIQKIFREQVKQNPKHWISLVTELRDQGPGIWSQWSQVQKKQFLRHVKSYWEVSRHRTPAPVFDLLMNLKSKGRVKVHAGRVSKTEKIQDHVEVSFLSRNDQTFQTLRTKWIVMATNAKISQNLELDEKTTGLRPCELGLGYQGKASKNLWLLGPPMKSESWETTAIPDIVKEADQIVREL